MNLCTYFPMTRIINLEDRRDRRREIEKEIAAVGMRFGVDGVEVFKAIRPKEAAGFPSPGVRGCFLSHLGVLREALAKGVESVLILEDDLAISPSLSKVLPDLFSRLGSEPWGLAYFGYTDLEEIPVASDRQMAAYSGSVRCGHFYAVHKRVLAELISFLETLQTRPLGDPAGGPMHYDGALATYRAQNPQVLTLLAYPCLGFQRSSRSDIYIRWYERIAGLRQASEFARKTLARRRKKTGRASVQSGV